MYKYKYKYKYRDKREKRCAVIHLTSDTSSLLPIHGCTEYFSFSMLCLKVEFYFFKFLPRFVQVFPGFHSF